MLNFLLDQQREIFLARHPITDEQWQDVAALPLLRGLSGEESALLRQQCAWFLHKKTITPIADLALSPAQCLLLAVQACLPILNLGFDGQNNWKELVVYPSAFRVRDLQRELAGGGLVIEHLHIRDVRGLAHADGPVVISWEDAEISPWLDGWNVLIHEIAHKLDMLNGDANGCPPLHAGMSHHDWKAAFEPAFADLCRRDQSDEESAIDLYAASSPAECFAVCSECFFELPHVLMAHYPAVYEQLRLFYRQDPQKRLDAVSYRPILPEMRDLIDRALL